MALMRRASILLATVVLLSASLTTRAADFEKYLPDDTSEVFVVNVKQAIASPLFTKNYQKLADDMLKQDVVQKLLKDSGFDPFKDVDRATISMGRGSYKMKVISDGKGRASNGPFPFVIVEGRFDAAKLQARAKQFATDMPTRFKQHQVGDTAVWEFVEDSLNSHYFALLGKNMLVYGSLKDQVTDALERAAGKKKAMPKTKDLSALIAKMDAKQAVSWVMTGETSLGLSVKATFGRPGAGAVREITAFHPLSEQSIENIAGGMTVGDDIQVRAVVAFKDADKAKETAKLIEGGIGEGIKELAGAKEAAPLLDSLKTVKVATQDKTATVQGQATAAAINAALTFLGTSQKGAAPKEDK